MKLSLCMIARDEETNIGRALRSVASVADELIVADTGSTDRTVEVARGLGARVSHFPWCDDFAAARNYAVAQATGDWILWLDADEELLTGSHRELRRRLARAEALAYLVLRQDLVSADDLDTFTEMWQLRLFRRHADLRFLGRCHPDFRSPTLDEVAARLGKRVLPSTIRLRHFGYASEALRAAKLRRAVRLLALELAERPDQLYYLIEYGRVLLRLGDAKAHEVLEAAARQVWTLRYAPTPPMPLVASLLEEILAAPPDLHTALSPADARALAQRWFPRSAPLLWQMAREDFQRGRFAEAAATLETLVRLGETGAYDRHTSFDPRILGDEPKLNLGVCHLRLGRLDPAERCFRALLDSRVVAQEAATHLAAVQALRTAEG